MMVHTLKNASIDPSDLAAKDWLRLNAGRVGFAGENRSTQRITADFVRSLLFKLYSGDRRSGGDRSGEL